MAFINTVDPEIMKFLLENFEYTEPSTFSETECKHSIAPAHIPLASAFAIQLGLQGFSSDMKAPDVHINKKVEKGEHVKKVLNIVKNPKTPVELTYSRLTRVFKNEIRDFIKQTGKVSQLCKKYYKGDKHADCIFYGCEYLELDDKELAAVADVFNEMDRELASKNKKGGFVEKLERIQNAKRKTG